jgi:hypothetical protein
MGCMIQASELTGRARTATIAHGRDEDVVFPRKPKDVGAWFDLPNDHQLVVLDGASDDGVWTLC